MDDTARLWHDFLGRINGWCTRFDRRHDHRCAVGTAGIRTFL